MTAARLAVLAGALALAGCAAPRETVRVVREPVQVQVPVAVPCVAVERLPAPPALPTDAELARLDDRALVLALERQRRLLREYQSLAAPLLAACAGPADLQREPQRPKEATQ